VKPQAQLEGAHGVAAGSTGLRRFRSTLQQAHRRLELHFDAVVGPAQGQEGARAGGGGDNESLRSRKGIYTSLGSRSQRSVVES
jgi:hypothetical protein